MKQSIRISALITMVTAAIGVILWFNGYPPEKEGLSEGAAQLRAIFTFPLFWAGAGLALGLTYIWFKRDKLAEQAGKAGNIPAFAVQLPALLALMFQILFPLDIYGVVESSGGGQVVMFYFMTALFLVVGNFIVAAPFGSRIGFRTAATLSNEKVWSKVHRTVGRNLVLIALITLPLPWFIDPQIALWIMIGLVACAKFIAWTYARRLVARVQSASQPVSATR